MYNGERSRLARMTSFVLSFVFASQHITCSVTILLDVKEKGVGTLSPGCSENLEKSSEFLFTLGVVPVFNRPSFKPRPSREPDSLFDGGSPSLPPSLDSRPTNMRPFRNVPVATMTAFALYSAPDSVMTPVIFIPSDVMESTMVSTTSRLD